MSWELKKTRLLLVLLANYIPYYIQNNALTIGWKTIFVTLFSYLSFDMIGQVIENFNTIVYLLEM